MSVRDRKNEYMLSLPEGLFRDTPKSVFAAVALSMCFIDQEEQGFDVATARFMREWQALYDNNIVSQKPPSKYTQLKEAV